MTRCEDAPRICRSTPVPEGRAAPRSPEEGPAHPDSAVSWTPELLPRASQSVSRAHALEHDRIPASGRHAGTSPGAALDGPPVLELAPVVITVKRGPDWQPAPPLVAVEEGRRMLGRGHRGESVRQLQHYLSVVGEEPVATDGFFGPKTQEALYAYQKAHGLTEERGRLGPKTLEALSITYVTSFAVSPELQRLDEGTKQVVEAFMRTHQNDFSARRAMVDLVGSEAFAQLPEFLRQSAVRAVAKARDPRQHAEELRSVIDEPVLARRPADATFNLV